MIDQASSFNAFPHKVRITDGCDFHQRMSADAVRMIETVEATIYKTIEIVRVGDSVQ
jgi:hypothetical protein